MSAAETRDPRMLLNRAGLDEVIRESHERRKPIREAVYMLEDLVNELAELAEQRDGVVRPMKPHDVSTWLIRARAMKERLEKL